MAAYAPNATISISSNTLRSRSVHYDAVKRNADANVNTISFDKWTALPGRNLFRGVDKVEQRMRTLKSPTDPEELQRWWLQAVPKTQHPLEDPAKWLFDGWVLDGTGTDTRICAMIQGEFKECKSPAGSFSISRYLLVVPSGTLRSFTRTFVLTDPGQSTM